MLDTHDVLARLAGRAGPERRLLEASWRFQVIAPLMDEKRSRLEKRAYRKEVHERGVEHPWRGLVVVSPRNLRRWCQKYRQFGLAGLVPVVREDAGQSTALPEGALQQALALREEDGRRTIPTLIHLLEATHPEWVGTIKRSTLDRHLRLQGSVRQRRVVPQGPFRTFEADGPSDLWQGDILVGPVVVLKDDKLARCHVVCWLDDFSRHVCHLEAYPDDSLASVEDALRQAILKYGLPLRIFVDNAKVYSGGAFEMACSELGIQKIHSTPRYPVSRGKQERFFGTLRQQLLNEVENIEPLPLARLNGILVAWLTTYHHRLHSATEQTPTERFASRAHRLVDGATLERAFLQWDTRAISPVGEIKFHGNSYRVDPSLTTRKAVIRYNPRDLSRIYVWKDGRKLATATAHELIHPVRPGKSLKARCRDSEAAWKLLEQYEQGHRQTLAHELNRTEYRPTNPEDDEEGGCGLCIA